MFDIVSSYGEKQAWVRVSAAELEGVMVRTRRFLLRNPPERRSIFRPSTGKK